MSYYGEPNQPGAASRTAWSGSLRLAAGGDHNFTDRQRIFVRASTFTGRIMLKATSLLRLLRGISRGGALDY
jgi:hypothetical protein